MQKESKLPSQPVLPSHGISYRPDVEAHANQVGVATAFVLQKKAEREKWEKSLEVPEEIQRLPDDVDEENLTLYTDFLLGKPVVMPEKESVSESDDQDVDGVRVKRQTGLNKQYRKKRRKLRKARIGREIDAVKAITRKMMEEDAERRLRWKQRVKRKLQRARFGSHRIGKRRFQVRMRFFSPTRPLSNAGRDYVPRSQQCMPSAGTFFLSSVS